MRELEKRCHGSRASIDGLALVLGLVPSKRGRHNRGSMENTADPGRRLGSTTRAMRPELKFRVVIALRKPKAALAQVRNVDISKYSILLKEKLAFSLKRVLLDSWPSSGVENNEMVC